MILYFIFKIIFFSSFLLTTLYKNFGIKPKSRQLKNLNSQDYIIYVYMVLYLSLVNDNAVGNW